MSPALLVALATLLFVVLKRYIEFRQAVKSIQYVWPYMTVHMP